MTFFFFKQKTAYEMRIRYWSSDVCSSDLFSGHGARGMERALDQRLLDPAMRGEPVALSLDTRVQAAMESELGAAVSKFKALAGAGIVLDVNTGEVLAMEIGRASCRESWGPYV